MSEETTQRRLRRHLHFDALVGLLRERFEKIPDHRRDPRFSLADTAMAGLALFSLKDSSLLAFVNRPLDHNLRSVFGLKAIPSDSQMREILDEVDPQRLRPSFRDVFRQLQRGKVLEDYVFLEGCYLLALDGVEYFHSKKVHCERCMSRQLKSGETEYYHQMLGAALIHPDFPEVIPLCPEPIQRQDGQTKNDCERNAARRWLKEFRREHPHLPVIITEDALSSNGPHVHDLMEANCHFILGVKPGDHTHLFQQFDQRAEAGQAETVEEVDADGTERYWTFVADLELNESNRDVLVTLVQYLEVPAEEAEEEEGREFTWITDLRVSKENVKQVARGGRTRWRIENETFNTLKNQGYHFEHNFGHGYEHLCVVFATLMMLAFLIDQVQQKCNPLFRQAWEKKGRKCALWEAMRQLFASFVVSSMREIYEAIAFGYERPRLKDLIEQTRTASPATDTS